MVIRRHPEDFVVREVLTRAITGKISELPGPRTRFAVYRVEKDSMTTREAAGALAGDLGAPAGAVSWAGMKDKHARTVQHMTVPVVGGPMAMARRADRGPLRAELVGWCEQEAQASWIEANEFEIVIRDLTLEGAAALKRAAESRVVQSGGSRSIQFVNYFGAQRFGSARHGEGFAARALVSGNFDRALKLAIGTPARKETGTQRRASRMLAGKWGEWKELSAELPGGPERRAVEVLANGGDARAAFATLPHFTQQMCVESYQSWLWNLVAAEIVGAEATRAWVPRQPHVIDPLMGGLMVRMPGPDSVYEGRAADCVRRVLEAEGISLAELRVPGLRRPAFGSPERPLVTGAMRLDVRGPERDGEGKHRLTMAFALARGAYATVLLGAIEGWAEGDAATDPA